MDWQETIERYHSARDDPALAVLEGFHPLKHALRFGAEIREALSPRPAHLLHLAEELAPDVRDAVQEKVSRIPEELYEELAPRPPESGVIALARRPSHTAARILQGAEGGPVVYLERPTHLGNLGASVRVAAAAGAAGLVSTGVHDPWHASALRGSAGLHFALPVAAAEELTPLLHDSGRPLVAVDPRGEPLEGRRIPARAVLAFGSERRGLRDATLERADLRLRIPMRIGVSSLNLATSVAIVLYAWRSR